MAAVALVLSLPLPALASPGAGWSGPGCPMHRMQGFRVQGGMRGATPMMQHRMMQPGMMRHRGMSGSRGSNMADMQQIHTLLANHGSVRRAVKHLPNGVETVTVSSDPRVAALLPEHVNAMYVRLKEGRLIRGFDPLFMELFRQAGRIEIQVEPLQNGVRVVETSQDPYTVKLIQAHAQAVNGFVKDGMAAMHRTHAVPGRPSRSSSDGHHSDAVP